MQKSVCSTEIQFIKWLKSAVGCVCGCNFTLTEKLKAWYNLESLNINILPRFYSHFYINI